MRYQLVPDRYVRSGVSTDWREAQDDVEFRGQLADPRVFDRDKVNREQLAALRRHGAAIDFVLLVAGVALHEAFGRQQFLPAFADLKWMCGAGRPG